MITNVEGDGKTKRLIVICGEKLLSVPSYSMNATPCNNHGLVNCKFFPFSFFLVQIFGLVPWQIIVYVSLSLSLFSQVITGDKRKICRYSDFISRPQMTEAPK